MNVSVTIIMKNCEKCGARAENETSLADDDMWDFCPNCICKCPYCGRMVSYLVQCDECKTVMCRMEIDRCEPCNKLYVCTLCHAGCYIDEERNYRYLEIAEEAPYRRARDDLYRHTKEYVRDSDCSIS